MLKIRLRREGSRNHPFFRIVVSDSRNTPTGPNVATIGYYDPKKNPPTIKMDVEAYEGWVGKGAIPSTTVKSLMLKAKAAETAEPAS